MARLGWIIQEERKKAGRCLVLDTGDLFQGAVVFNEYMGEAEMQVMTEIGFDAVVVGNHDFGEGAARLSEVYNAYGNFDFLAANYIFEDPELPWAEELGDYVERSVMYEMQGLRVGIVGIGNMSSLTSITVPWIPPTTTPSPLPALLITCSRSRCCRCWGLMTST